MSFNANYSRITEKNKLSSYTHAYTHEGIKDIM